MKRYVFDPEAGTLIESEVPTTEQLAERAELDKQLAQVGVGKAHDCFESAVPYRIPGVGHGWECGVCGALVQTG